jgi:alpha-1,2-mannosyltransferase
MVSARARTILTWLGVAMVAVLAQAALWWISEPTYLFSDFYKAYYAAGEALLADGPRQTWYLAEPDVLAFVNLPILGYLFVPLAMLEPSQAAWVYLGLGVAGIGATLLLIATYFDLGPSQVAVLALLFAVNGPLVNSLREGNTSHFVILLLAASLVLILSGWRFTAGVILGFCAVLKLPLALLGVYYVLMRRWRLVAGGACSVATLGLLSLLVFGVETNIGWYDKCVAPYLAGVVGAFNVQSIDAFLLRLSTGETYVWDWEPVKVSSGHVLLRTTIVGSMFAGTLYLLLRTDWASNVRTARDRQINAALEFVLVLTLALVTSPLSWTHYYAALLLPAALLLAGWIPGLCDPKVRRLMYVGLFLAAMPVTMPDLNVGWFGPVLVRTVISIWLLGGLLTLAGLMLVSWRRGAV